MNSIFKYIHKVTLYFGDDKRNIVVSALILFFMYYNLNSKAFEGDIWCWRNWSNYALEYGFSNIYNSGTNYMPLNLYILTGFAFVFKNHFDINQYFYLFKMIYVLFDFFFLLIVLNYFKIQKDWLLIFILFFFNPAFLVNNYIFGQVDCLHSILVFFSILMAYKEKIEWSFILFTLAILTKLQALFFLPIIGFICLPIVVKYPKKLFSTLLGILITFFIVTFPFNNLIQIYQVAFNSIDQYKLVSMNAMNIWNLFFWGRDINLIDDTGTFGGITYKNYGFILFYIFSFIALFPLMKTIVLSIINKKTISLSLNKILLTSALIGLIFYFFPTQIHERYSHPIIYFLIAYALNTKKYFLVSFYSVLYFLSMERVLKYAQTYNYGIAVFDPKLLSICHLILLLFLFKELYYKCPEKTI